MANQRIVRKSKAGVQDLVLGKGQVTQQRGANEYQINRLDIPLALDTLAEMQALDVEDFTRARVYSDAATFVDYIYDEAATSGIAPAEGSGYWVLARPVAIDVVNVKAFGALGYPADDTNAFVLAGLAAAARGTNIYAPAAVYSITQLDLPEGVGIKGDGAPVINTWFNEVGDKPLLRPNFKHLMSGTVLLLTGTPTVAYTTNRTDKFSSMLYGLKYTHVKAATFQDFGIVMDMDVYDAGGALTTAATDNRSGHETGFLLRAPLAKLRNVTSFGYFTKGGLTIHSQLDLEQIDTDYVRAYNCDITSTVLIANNNADSQGLTGARFTDCGFYNAADHHNSIGGDGDFTLNAIYVDGNNGIAGLRGHSFAGNMRTRANNAILLDHCNDVSFDLAVETPPLAGVSGADEQGNIVGTANTGNVRLINIAQSSTNGLGINALASIMSGTLISLGGESNDEIVVSKGVSAVRLTGGEDGVIQITNDLTDGTSQWTLRKDTSNADMLSVRYDNVEALRLSADGTVRARSDLVVDGALNLTGSFIADAECDIRGTGAGVRLREGGATALLSDLTRTRPGGNNVQELGGGSNYWSKVYTHAVVMKSPNGTLYTLTVDDAGSLVVT